jgi:hypothetical protein
MPGQSAEVSPGEGEGPRVLRQEELLDQVLRNLGEPEPDESVN